MISLSAILKEALFLLNWGEVEKSMMLSEQKE